MVRAAKRLPEGILLALAACSSPGEASTPVQADAPVEPPAAAVAPPSRDAPGQEGTTAFPAWPVEAPVQREDLDALVDLRDASRWMSLEIECSTVTGTRRRIHFDRDAVVEALLAWEPGPRGETTALRYPDGAVFVAENLAEDGTVLETQVLRIRSEAEPEFLLFDRSGRCSEAYAPVGAAIAGQVPDVCLDCHRGPLIYEPMMSFPSEPEERALVLDPRYRDLAVVLRLLEGFHRGGRLFGPYGAIVISRLLADRRDGRLEPADRARLARLVRHDPGYYGEGADELTTREER